MILLKKQKLSENIDLLIEIIETIVLFKHITKHRYVQIKCMHE